MYCNILYLHMYYQIYELCLYIFSSDRFFIVLFFSVIVLVLVIDESLNNYVITARISAYVSSTSRT